MFPEAREATADQLIQALDQERFVLYCQPIVPVDSATVDNGYLEIFVRFLDEEEKMQFPGAFFPVLEANRLIGILDQWVVGRVLKWICNKREGEPGWPIPLFSVNLAPQTIRDPDFPEFVHGQLAAAKVPADRLSFELSARQFVDRREDASRLLGEMAGFGCPVTVTGLTAGGEFAQMIRDAGASAVKIDGAIVREILADSFAFSKASEINRKCLALGMRTIGELVEDRGTRRKLREIGVQYVQGFGVAEPFPLSRAG